MGTDMSSGVWGFAQGLPGLGRRLLQAVALALLVGSLSFAMVRALPGDVAMRVAAARYGHDLVGQAAATQVSEELGLTQSAWVQWGHWVVDLAQGRLGVSLVSGQAVAQEVGEALGATLRLALVSLLLAMSLGVPLGVWAGSRPAGWLDRTIVVWAAWGRACPPFLVAVGLMMLVALHTGGLPVAGDTDAGGVWLPALTLALGMAAGLARVTRQAVSDYVGSPVDEFCRSTGLSDRRSLWCHGLRHAALPLVSYLGVQSVLLVEGAVVVESIFAWPGIGHELVHAVFGRDVPMIQGAALCMGLMVVVFNAGVDVLGWTLDPRRRQARS